MAMHTFFSLPRPYAGPGAILRCSALLLGIVLAGPPLLSPRAGRAAVSMETGGRSMRLDDSGMRLSGTGEHNARRDNGGVILQTPPRPAANGTQVQELPWGIVPEVHVPWYPPGKDRRPASPGWKSDQNQRPASPGGDAGRSWRPSHSGGRP